MEFFVFYQSYPTLTSFTTPPYLLSPTPPLQTPQPLAPLPNPSPHPHSLFPSHSTTPKTVHAEVEQGSSRFFGKGKRKGGGDREKELQSAKKNSESNLVNQVLGFLSSQQRSQPVVDRAIGQLGKSPAEVQQLRPIFYNTVRMVNLRRGRRYVNSSCLLTCCRPASLAAFLPHLAQQLDQTDLITLDQLCLVFRRACFQLIRETSLTVILTSRRITGAAKPYHLRRRRRVEAHLLTD